MTAAMGIPKLETGPQKSRNNRRLAFWLISWLGILRVWSFRISWFLLNCLFSSSVLFAIGRSRCRKPFGRVVRTGWADIVQHRVGADLSVDSLYNSSHGEVARMYHNWVWIRRGWYLKDAESHPASAVSREWKYYSLHFAIIWGLHWI